MKPRESSPEQDKRARQALCEAFLSLANANEVAAFLSDLTTPAELQALADRWLVVGLLKQGLAYREIAERTGVSVTTTGRVARCMGEANSGYNIAWQRVAGEQLPGEANG